MRAPKHVESAQIQQKSERAGVARLKSASGPISVIP
jgi:hypothetical protein